MKNFRPAHETPVGDRLDQIQCSVTQLHSSLNVVVDRLSRLQTELETLRAESTPLEVRRQQPPEDEKTVDKTTRLGYVGVGLSVQLALLARWTYEFSWEETSPIAYFIKFTIINQSLIITMIYAYSLVTRRACSALSAALAKKMGLHVKRNDKFWRSVARVVPDLGRPQNPPPREDLNPIVPPNMPIPEAAAQQNLSVQAAA